MNSKDKAIELFNKFNLQVSQEFNSDTFKSATIAKKCALIAVDEIIQNNYNVLDGNQYHQELNIWQEVKQEIEKL